jgi:hypothetical protein
MPGLGEIERYVRKDARRLAEVQGEQVRLSLPRPLPSPPAKGTEWLQFSEGSLHSRRTSDRNHQPLVGALARSRMGHLLRGAYDTRGRTSDRRPFLGSSRNDTQRTCAAVQRRLGEIARRSKDPNWHNSSDLWRRIGAMGPVICLALAHGGEGNSFDMTRARVAA